MRFSLDKRWYENAAIPVPQGALWVGALVVLCFALEWGPGGEWVRRHVSHPALFSARTALGGDPSLDEHIVVWGMGDSSLGRMGKADLSLEDWALVLRALDAAHPQAILIDKFFSQAPQSEGEGERFVDAIRALGAPVIPGAFLSGRSIEGRDPLPWSHPAVDSTVWAKGSGLEGFPQRTGSVYGPHRLFWGGFPKIGHVMVQSGGFVEPVVRLKDPSGLLFAPLWAAKERRTVGGDFHLNGAPLSVDSRGRHLVNLAHPDRYRPHVRPLAELVERARTGQPLGVSPGSVAVILTSYATGETHQVESPHGPTQPAFFYLAALNTAVGGPRLAVGSWGGLAILVMLGVALVVASRWRGAWALGSLAGVGLAYGGGALWTFLQWGWVVSWVPPLLALWGAGAGLLSLRWFHRARNYRRLIDRFEGLLPEDKLRALSKEEGRKWLQPRAQVVTVLFVDIVGFSSLAERFPPDEVFSLLRTLFQEMAGTIHRWGGVIDKTLGDGLLAYFGVGENEGGREGNHADWALACAQEIQRANAERVAATAEGRPVFPFRIGINTSAVVLGDLGGFKRVDFTLIGHGVNLAKRFETACEPFRVMVGPTTAQMLTTSEHLRLRIPGRWIHIKNQDEPVEAREVNPLASAPDLEARARKVYRSFARLERIDARIALAPGQLRAVIPGLGAVEVLNYSRGGFSFRAPRYLGRGYSFSAALQRGDTESPLTEHPIVCSIRWGDDEGEKGFVHGAKFESLNLAQKEELLAQLQDALRALKPAA